jgi:diguanylate cyclase (GGDEF)-like protein/PAS domain S-box-containing protein
MQPSDLPKGWKKPPLPENEEERLAALHGFSLLDTPAEEVFDAITRIAAQICNAPIALISLVDRDRQWFKSNYGLPGVSETPRDSSFCAHAIAGDKLMEVPDAARDERFRANPLVTGGPKFRFYAGVPLDDGRGHKLGTLCVMDRHPRELSPAQRAMLEELSSIIVRTFEWRRRGVETGTRIGRLLDQSDNEIFVLDPQTLRCLYANRGAIANTGYALAELQSLDYFALFPSLDREMFLRDVAALRSGARKRIDCEAVCRRRDGSSYVSRSNLQFHPDSHPPVVTMMSEDITDRKRIEGELQAYVAGLTAVIAIQQEIATRSLDLETLMRLIVVRAREITGAKGAVIGLMEDNELIYRAATDEALSQLGQKLEMAGALSTAALREATALRCNEAQADPRVDRDACMRLGVRSLVVAPFYRDNRPAGVLKVFSGDAHAFTDQTAQLVQLLATTLGGAMHRHASDLAILEIARGASIESGRDFFKTLVTELAALLGASHVFIGQLAADGRQIRLVAANTKGDAREGIGHSVAGALCDHVLDGEPQVVTRDVKGRFPADDMLQKLDVEAYVGVPLVAADRKTIGLLAALFGAELSDPDRVQSMLQIFAARVASELERQHADRKLRDQTGVLQSVLDSIADGVIVADEHGRLLLVNPAARRIVGLPITEKVSLKNLPAHYGIHRADGKTLFPAEELPIIQAVQDRATDSVELVIRNAAFPDGIVISAHGRPLHGPDGQVRGGVMALRDVTQVKRSELEVRKLTLDLESRVRERTAEVESVNSELEARNDQNELLNELSKILQSCVNVAEGCDVLSKFVPRLFPDYGGGLYLQNAERKSLELRTAWGGALRSEELFGAEQCWGLRRGQLHFNDGRTSGLVCQHLHSGSAETLATMCVPLVAQGETIGLLYLERKAGAKRVSLRSDQSDPRLASTLAEQFALALANIQLRETLRNQSIRDPLTGLYNRRFLEESFRLEWARAQRKQTPLALMMVDVDHFKRYNDKHGHDAGDYVLRELGNLLARFIRESDIACRYGGEEFVLLLPGASGTDANSRARALLSEVRKLNLNFQGTHLGRISVSIGLAVYPDHVQDADGLLQAADAALYAAKGGGRDRVTAAGEKPRAKKRSTA